MRNSLSRAAGLRRLPAKRKLAGMVKGIDGVLQCWGGGAAVTVGAGRDLGRACRGERRRVLVSRTWVVAG